ncbi:unnamed protein product [Acanthoscelides obtectus]|uniref:Cystathionine beta-synthase n=1 Tax=Acanthoscelides obtectus TaxID=200917 RepID=A0A9P0P6Z9_ACAOB|nr:unnamed protein product [Acanthoscelides obtectus]CAK1669339.1 Cystathionine beta-synthase [Acanthoscelides obtectus]
METPSQPETLPADQQAKKMKASLQHWSPLNDGFAMPDHKPKCKWHMSADRNATPHHTEDWKKYTKVLSNALDAIGNTPMIKLNKIPQAEGLECDVFVKCEFFNPGGSVKDRIGYRMVLEAEKQGVLKPGYTLIEPSSGNTGIGIALAAAVKGYRCIIVMSEKMSNEKVAVLQALGAEIVRTPVDAASDAPDGLFGVSYRLRKEITNSVILDQYSNPGNPLAHYDNTAEEIFHQCDGKIDMMVIGAGTGGTVTGIGRKLKEISPQTTIVAADPYGSVMAQPECLNKTDVTFYEVEGIGYDFIPTVLDRGVIDKWVKTEDKEALILARRLIREEGLLVGSSCGAALAATLKAAKDLPAGKRVVVLFADGIRNYLTKFVSDQWMEARLFKPAVNTHNHWWWDVPAYCLELQTLQTATPSMTCDRIMNIMKKFGVDQIPVVDCNNGGVIGVVTLQNLTSALIESRIKPNESIEKLISRIYPKVYKTTNLGVVARILEKESYCLLLESHGSGATQVDKPVGIATHIDLLQFITNKPEGGSVAAK